jgi:prolipoprotein diacylglyceryltransferase
MSGTLLHAAFDALAWAVAGLSFIWLTRYAGVRFTPSRSHDLAYLATLVFGAGIGAFAFGSANLWLSQQQGLARSIEGALAGGIIAVELYKRSVGITGRTGARFALPLAVGVAVGRIGCFFAGLDDFTYGTPTALPWAHDFGDGVPRHPVQLYESAAMAGFALVYVRYALRGNVFVIENGFYLATGFYGAQRFALEFLKPYGALVGPLTLFHLLSAAITIYAIVMIAIAPSPRTRDDTAVA